MFKQILNMRNGLINSKGSLLEWVNFSNLETKELCKDGSGLGFLSGLELYPPNEERYGRNCYFNSQLVHYS